jgi:hypothetical protein
LLAVQTKLELLGTTALDEDTALELELGETDELLGGAVWLDELVTIKLLLDGVLLELFGTELDEDALEELDATNELLDGVLELLCTTDELFGVVTLDEETAAELELGATDELPITATLDEDTALELELSTTDEELLGEPPLL